MAAYYDSIKSMKSAKVGTIMPWGGDGGSGFLASNIPKGWIVCDGRNDLNAKDYPLLASIIGDTYGGDMSIGSPTFPYEDDPNVFGVPNLSNRAMMDLESWQLDLPKYQMGQSNPKNVTCDSAGTKLGDLIKDYGETVSVKTTWSATADIDFTLNFGTNPLYFKINNIKLALPDFTETIYTLGRKLGMNHIPSHRHNDTIPSTNIRSRGAMTFRVDNGVEMKGTVSTVICSRTRPNVECQSVDGDSASYEWTNGRDLITYYGDDRHEWTLPRCETFMEFVNDGANTTNPAANYWSHVPTGENHWNTRANDTDATRGSGHKSNVYTQNVQATGSRTAAIPGTTPLDTHKMPAYTGMFPRPTENASRPNFYGYTSGSGAPSIGGITDHPEAMPAFEVFNVNITNGTTEITLPAGTDIRRSYGTAPNTWYQWDAIRPWMYVQPSDASNRWKYFPEGTMIQQIVENANGTYKIILNNTTTGTGTIRLMFRDGSYPMTLNLPGANKNPLENAFKSHMHDSFEIAQTGGSMTDGNKILTSYTASDGNPSTLVADSIENALNISCDTAQASLTVTCIIKAY